MNSSQAIERAIRKITPAPARGELVALRTALAVSIASALRTVAEMLALRAPEDVERQLLETTVSTLAVTAGVADLAAWVLANPTYLTKTIDTGKIYTAAGGYPLQEVTDELQLTFPWPAFFIYFCISGNKIKTRNTDGLLTSLTDTLTVTLLAVPTLALLAVQLEPLVIAAMLAELNGGQTSQTKKRTTA